MNISGKYNSNQGEMHLEQTDNIVTGSYSLNGSINGLIENNKLKAIWKNGNHEGLLELEFNEDNSFAGKYKKGKEDGPMRGKWDGTIISSTSVSSNIENDVEIDIPSDDKFETKTEKKLSNQETLPVKNPDPSNIGNLFNKRDYEGVCYHADLNRTYSNNAFDKILFSAIETCNSEVFKICKDIFDKLRYDWHYDNKNYDFSKKWKLQFEQNKSFDNKVKQDGGNGKLPNKEMDVLENEKDEIHIELDYWQKAKPAIELRSKLNASVSFDKNDTYYFTNYYSEFEQVFLKQKIVGLKEDLIDQTCILTNDNLQPEIVVLMMGSLLSFNRLDSKDNLKATKNRYTIVRNKIEEWNSNGLPSEVYGYGLNKVYDSLNEILIQLDTIDIRMGSYNVLKMSKKNPLEQLEKINTVFFPELTAHLLLATVKHNLNKYFQNEDKNSPWWFESNKIKQVSEIMEEKYNHLNAEHIYTSDFFQPNQLRKTIKALQQLFDLIDGANSSLYNAKSKYNESNFEKEIEIKTIKNKKLEQDYLKEIDDKKRKIASENGFQVIKYKSGDVFEGELVNNIKNGKGKYTWASGQIYEGDFVNDLKTGKGKYTWASGQIYEGDFLNGEYHGKGKFVFEDGSIYEGDFIDGKYHGKGKFIWVDGDIYDGLWINGIKQGLSNFELIRKKEDDNKALIKAKEEALQREKDDIKKERELELKKAMLAKEKEKAAAEKEKNKKTSFEIEYKIKLTKAKSETHYKGESFGMIGIILNGGKTEQLKTHDRGETIIRTISISHKGQTMSNSIAKHYVEENDSDVIAGRAGSSTILILNIT